MQINIDDYVWVQLTEFGEKVYAKHFQYLGKNVKPPPYEKTPNGWAKFRMRELLGYFGGEWCFIGGPQQVFKENILRFASPDP